MGRRNSQLQQRQIGIAVVGAVLALLCDIVLEYGRCLGIVSVEATEDGFDVFGPVGRIVKGYAHGCLVELCGILCGWVFEEERFFWCGCEFSVAEGIASFYMEDFSARNIYSPMLIC